MTETPVRLAIIADDLTGSLDTGVAFAARGWRTVVRLAGCEDRSDPSDPSDPFDPSSTFDSSPPACDAIVWDTETREADEETARRAVRAVCEQPSVRSAPRVYKKIDSTLRGPWLAELREVWEARAPLVATVCPAFPAVGRTVVAGEVRVHGRPLEEAGFSGTGRLREVLADRWQGRVLSVPAPLGEVDASGWRTERRPTFAPTAPTPYGTLSDPAEKLLVLADAETDSDLDDLVAYLQRLSLDDLLCGAGGLAAAWARLLIPEPAPLPPLEPITGPIWILAGSQHPATRAQMEALARTPDGHAEWFSAHTPDFGPRLHRLTERATQGLCLTLSLPHSLTPSFAAWAAEFIAAVVAEARERGVAGFAATGGETAALLLRAMGAEAVRIDRELLPGIPLCRIADGAWAGTPLITKAGGFGEPDALARAVEVARGV